MLLAGRMLQGSLQVLACVADILPTLPSGSSLLRLLERGWPLIVLLRGRGLR